MNMYSDNGTKIGTKTIQQGTGQYRADNSRGNSITMRFNPPTEQPKTQQTQPNYNNSYGTMGSGVTAPKIQYETPKGDENFSRILRNIAQSRNAKAQTQYDQMNANLYDQNADRKQRAYQYDKTRDDINRHFDRNMDFQIQSQKQINALKNVMTPYQNALLKNKNQEMLIKRQNIVNNGGFNSLLPTDVEDEIDLNGKSYQQAKQQYLKTGIVPQFKKGGDGQSWYDDDYYVIDETPIAQAPQSNQPSSDLAQQRAYKRWVQAKNEEIMNR